MYEKDLLLCEKDFLLKCKKDGIAALDYFVATKWCDAKFHISMFDSIDEAENKILCNDNTIIFLDKNVSGKDCIYVIRKQRNKEHIYYKDVINTLIKNKFLPYNKYLEDFHDVLESIPSDSEDCIRIFKGLWGN